MVTSIRARFICLLAVAISAQLIGHPSFCSGRIQEPERSIDSPHSVLSSLEAMCQGILSKKAITLTYEYHFGSATVTGTEEIQLSHSKRVELDLYPDGSISERAWRLGENKKPVNLLPDLEVQYGGKGVAAVQIINGRTSVSYQPEPTPSDAAGIRGDGILVPLGRTSWHSMDTLSVFKLAASGRLTLKNTDGITTLNSQCDAGDFSCKINGDGQLVELITDSAKPSHLHYGRPLGKTAYERVHELYSDFEFVKPNDENLFGVKSWEVLRTAKLKTGADRKLKGLVKVVSCKINKTPVPDCLTKLDFRTPLKDGTQIIVVGNPHVEFEVGDGRIRPVVDEELEEKIKNAVSTRGSEKGEWPRGESAGLCGVYSLFASACSVGAGKPLADFLKPEYCGEGYGSSTIQICLSARDNGLHTKAVTGLAGRDVVNLKNPAILHFRPRGALNEYIHWVTFLGSSNDGSATILDPTYGIEEMPISELAARFDGTAILIGKSEAAFAPTLNRLRAVRIKNGFLITLGVLGLIAGVNVLIAKWPKRQPFVLVGSLTGSLIIGCFYHYAFADGLFQSKENLAFTMAASASLTIPEVGNEIFLDQTNVLLVDARPDFAFRSSTIKNSINYPLDLAWDEAIKLHTELAAKDDKIVVFCQNQSCTWSDAIAKRLVMGGCKNVAIYRGGFNEWQDYQKQN